ncbi:acyl-CoA dehydrogenase family protein [Salinirubellus salinus]|uniref:Acyl-CoA dehydrogenase family protein n=1 Tax=Salinirubellus salinus TaxID=1364945 RepID=A0A9E7R2E7_9EURY|nr:acyl-CoA dehydrogenase family protein [Salinirubellus salinus]UWM54516.1 acyl-CoA dehydrogenase family protein [Salinirubellus salinus]
MEFQLTDEQRLVKRTASELAESQFADAAFTWDGDIPWPNVETLADQGLLGISLPEAYGGGGYEVLDVLLAQEAVGRVCPDTAHVLSRSSMGVPRVIAELGSDYLKERYLPPVTAGESILSIAISESEAGSDAGAMQTTAREEGDEVVLDGHKMWVSKGTHADAFLVYARFAETDRIGAVVVDADAPGLTVEDGYVNMADHRQNVLRFDDCRIPVEHELAVGADAFKELLAEFNVERCHNAMMCVACGLNAFDTAREHAADREQFGQPIGEFQAIEHKLADMAINLDAARLLVYRTAANARGGTASRMEASIAKVFANEAGQEVVDQAMQICGAMGYSKDSPLEYLYRWVRGWRIAGGTVEIHRNGIAEQLRKYGFE